MRQQASRRRLYSCSRRPAAAFFMILLVLVAVLLVSSLRRLSSTTERSVIISPNYFRRQSRGLGAGDGAIEGSPLSYPQSSSIVSSQASPSPLLKKNDDVGNHSLPGASNNFSSFSPPSCERFIAERRRKSSQFNATRVADYYAREYEMTSSLKDQLVKYASKVQMKRLGESKQLWEGYEREEVAPSQCLGLTPECAIFLHPDLHGTNVTEVSAAAMSFLFRKCCIEHRALRHALECLRQSRIMEYVWLTAGSLLGSIREPWGIVIPWDTDLDGLVEGGGGSSERTAREILASGTMTIAPSEGTTAVSRNNASTSMSSCATKLVDKADHAHGHLLGYVYGRAEPRHADDSRIELWIRKEDRKMQRASINLPPSANCDLYGKQFKCPKDPGAVLASGYGDGWCWPCKHRTSSCKGVAVASQRT